MEREKMMYQVASYSNKTQIHMVYSVYEDRKEAEEFEKYLKNYKSDLDVWINQIPVYFKK